MARYISTAQRRRTASLLAGGALVIGLAGGYATSALTATSVKDQVGDVKSRAQATSALLGVPLWHIQNGKYDPTSLKPTLTQAGADLQAEINDAPWVGDTAKRQLESDIASLQSTDPSATTVVSQLTELIALIDQTFGNR